MKLDYLNKINRLVIYFFYDADGIVDKYVPYMLEGIKDNCSEIIVVCNGKLDSAGENVFNKLADHVLIRENTGFDVLAYKAAIEFYGWDRLQRFDEVVFMNHTIMGPVYPLSDMFAEMNKRDIDFWGITKYHRNDRDYLDTGYPYIPEHIQSHFIAVRNSMLISLEFKLYWESRPQIQSYTDAVCKHEAIFTKTFSDFGYEYQVYCDTSELERMTEYPLLFMPTKMLESYKCPIFKRKSFFHSPYSSFLNVSDGSQGRELLSFLSDCTDYDVSMIWENILRTSNMADIHQACSLFFVLPASTKLSSQKELPKLALVMHIYSTDYVEYCFKYAMSMPEYAELIITTDTESKAEYIRECFSKKQWAAVRIIVIENRGRDVSALLIGAAPFLENYDLVCFAHDKKVAQLQPGLKGYTWSEKSYRNVLGTEEYVQNILDLFEKNSHLGIACPPPPNHAEYLGGFLTNNWGHNYPNTVELHSKLGLTCPISQEKTPIAPYGSVFWFRPAALKKLFDSHWTYEDFPEEPLKEDGTISHAIERIYPFVAQEAGYYTAYIMSDEYARTELMNLTYIARDKRQDLTSDGLLRYIAPRAKKFFSPKVWLLLKKLYSLQKRQR